MGLAKDDDENEPTVDASCPVCTLRARIDAACVRSGTPQITVVVRYQRVAIGPCAVPEAWAVMSSPGPDGETVRGEGACYEEAVAHCLEQLGVEVLSSSREGPT